MIFFIKLIVFLIIYRVAIPFKDIKNVAPLIDEHVPCTGYPT